jgi:uncharacterized protein (TIGR02646 family)
MIFVEISLLDGHITPEWIEKARKAKRDIKKTRAGGGDVSKAIKRRSNVWSELKQELSELSHEKCWYCESKQVRSDCHVDHFRPKSAVTAPDEPEHEGYWWLAFEWTNYRFCCTYCNSRRTDRRRGKVGGKGAHFPIKQGCRRCSSEEDLLSDELPTLLDPTDALDPKLITFDMDGAVRPSVKADVSEWLHERASVSINLYHLDQVSLQEERKAVCDGVIHLVGDADAAFRELMKGGVSAKARVDSSVDRLINMTCASAPYSSAARATLRSFRSIDRPWIDIVLERV